MAGTIMSGLIADEEISSRASKITKYSLFAGGLDMTHAASEIYTPLIGGYGRLFMVRKPLFLENTYSDELKTFKHILEYGNTGVSGIGDITLESENMTGGYAGKSVDMPTVAKDDTQSFTVKVYEFTGSPVRSLLHLWVTGIADPMTGLATYHGADTPFNQANHSAEFIYLVTDRTGNRVEYACMLANCVPKKVPEDFFNYDAGNHSLATIDVEFSCVKYESLAINVYATRLLNAFKILGNHLNFDPGLHDIDAAGGVVSTSATGNAPNLEYSTPENFAKIPKYESKTLNLNSNTLTNAT